MGGTQSVQDGPKVITVEDQGGGETDIVITQDFIQYVQDLNQGEGTKSQNTQRNSKQPNESGTHQSTSGGVEGWDQPHDNNWLPTYGFGESDKWKQLYEEEKARNQDFHDIGKKHFESAANSVKQQFAKSSLAGLVPVCEDCKEEVLNCYKENPNMTLNCSAVVKEFASCVQKARESFHVQTLSTDN